MGKVHTEYQEHCLFHNDYFLQVWMRMRIIATKAIGCQTQMVSMQTCKMRALHAVCVEPLSSIVRPQQVTISSYTLCSCFRITAAVVASHPTTTFLHCNTFAAGHLAIAVIISFVSSACTVFSCRV